MISLYLLFFEDCDYSSLVCHLLRTFVCDLCLIWWCWVTYSTDQPHCQICVQWPIL